MPSTHGAAGGGPAALISARLTVDSQGLRFGGNLVGRILGRRGLFLLVHALNDVLVSALDFEPVQRPVCIQFARLLREVRRENRETSYLHADPTIGTAMRC
jgi:hypothetical protein